MRLKDREEFCSSAEQDARLAGTVFPIVARGVFGPSPGEVLKNTKGKVGYFYYLFMLIQYVLAPFFYWLGPENMDPPIRDFLITHLGYNTGNWLAGALLLILCAELVLAVSLRLLLFPVGLNGKADWRWRS